MTMESNAAGLSTSRRLLIRFGLAVMVVLLPASYFVAQTTGPGTGKGLRSKKVGDLQTGPKAEPKGLAKEKALAVMNVKTPLALRVNRTKVKMEDELGKPAKAAAGAKMSKVAAVAAKLQPNKALQQKAAAVAVKPAGSHLHVVLRVTDKGKTEVLNVTEIAGPAVLAPEASGAFLYEVVANNETLAVQAIPDPFETRSFPRPGDKTGQHGFGKVETATVVVRVPDMNLKSPKLATVGIRLYRIAPGKHPGPITSTSVKQLRVDKRLQMRIDLKAQDFAKQAKLKGRVHVPPKVLK